MDDGVVTGLFIPDNHQPIGLECSHCSDMTHMGIDQMHEEIVDAFNIFESPTCLKCLTHTSGSADFSTYLRSSFHFGKVSYPMLLLLKLSTRDVRSR